MNSSNTTYDPTFGPWNSLQCRSPSILIVPTGEQNANGLVVAFYIYPLTRAVATIFSFRNSGDLAASFSVEITFNGYLFKAVDYNGQRIYEGPRTVDALRVGKQILLSL